jgi:stage V sporulation protein B
MLGKGTLTCMTTAHESGDRTALEQGSMQALVTSVVIAVPAAVGLFVFAPEILGILYPRQSDEAAICVSSLRYLMAGMVFLCVSYPLFSMLQAVGKPTAPLKIMLIGTAVKLAGNLLLIPFMGVDGAALSTTICYGVILVLSVRIFTASANLRLKLLPFIKIAYAGAMCGGAAYLTSAFLQKSEISVMIRLAFAGATGGIVYLILLVVLIGRTENKKCGAKYISG